jgi:hypothetical protein
MEAGVSVIAEEQHESGDNVAELARRLHPEPCPPDSAV